MSINTTQIKINSFMFLINLFLYYNMCVFLYVSSSKHLFNYLAVLTFYFLQYLSLMCKN